MKRAIVEPNSVKESVTPEFNTKRSRVQETSYAFFERFMWSFSHSVLMRCVRGRGFKNEIFFADSLSEGIQRSVFIVSADRAVWRDINGFPVNGHIGMFDCRSLVVADFIERLGFGEETLRRCGDSV